MYCCHTSDALVHKERQINVQSVIIQIVVWMVGLCGVHVSFVLQNNHILLPFQHTKHLNTM